MPVSQTITLPPNRPRNYLCVSICTCLFCFWPLGLVAMVFSCMVDSSYDAGDYAGAFTNAAIAKLLNSISYLFGLFLIIVFITTL
ncbi:trafficking regulator of GLUT4 1-like isoform X1 [Oculina patagonica]